MSWLELTDSDQLLAPTLLYTRYSHLAHLIWSLLALTLVETRPPPLPSRREFSRPDRVRARLIVRPVDRGTIGAAMSAAISGVPSIALSWGLMTHYKPPGKELVTAAAKVSCEIVNRLYQLGWGEGPNKCDVYSVNDPVSTIVRSI